MACTPVVTGSEFLVRTLSHLDCQAQTLGSFGFQSLASTGSPATIALTALLTLFIALYGIRLLFHPDNAPGDLVNAVIKIGIVLTMALSWPAWRVIAYDTVLHGPAEIAATVIPSTLPDPRAAFPTRLQAVDTGIAAMTAAGTGRQTGQIINEGATSGFRPIALEDEAGLGWSRPIYLASTIGSLAALRIAGGLLLALAPLLAGALLFDLSRGLFAGWLRGLALVGLGSLGLTVLLSVQVAIMEPWLVDLLERRRLGYATPTAPTELLALVIAFAIATAALLFILGKVAFQNAWGVNRPVIARFAEAMVGRAREPALAPVAAGMDLPHMSRAAAISARVAAMVRRESGFGDGIDPVRRIELMRSGGAADAHCTQTSIATPLGSSHRRTARREAQSQQRRDERG